MKSAELRKKFTDFFVSKGHTPVDSSSLVPAGDATLLFTNAGMVQFKDNFLGLNKSLTRATTVQKCVRAGGKHNDLENVGYTARHHTFFEMLGNFSFGDYFKKDAIAFAWEFVTEVLKLPKDRLYLTVHSSDDEAEKLWLSQKDVTKDRVFRCGDKDNFWAMGDTGPCGPCTEIFYVKKAGARYKNVEEFVAAQDRDECMEIWNLVFMQYDRDSSGKLTPLPRPCVDTGAGFERIASVLQGVDSNYHIDLFLEIIAAVEEVCDKKYGRSSSEDDTSMRVVADHLRACSFLIADGVIPSNEGRGYVLRRILRRAVRHGKRLGLNEPFLCKLYPTLLKVMGEAYPELSRQRHSIEQWLQQEESNFFATLTRGLEILDKEIVALKKSGSKVLSGETSFLLYDSFGFPLDLTETILAERGLSADQAGFEKAMGRQREQSKKSWKGSGEKGADSGAQEVYASGVRTEAFVGYDKLASPARLVHLTDAEGGAGGGGASKISHLFFDVTPFYGESGGQVGDTGLVTDSSGEVVARIKDTKKPFKDLFDHHAEVMPGKTLNVGQSYSLVVDGGAREKTRKNHTATHLLHAALRKVLGTHVQQAGSLVEPRRLRFDFSHFSGLTADQRKQIEELVNAEIARAITLEASEMDFDEAVGKGAMALFGEKYDKRVRVIRAGEFSCELCGGTHVSNTADIGTFLITSEEGIASGVRRIEAVTGPGAIEVLRKGYDALRSVSSSLKVADDKVAERVADLSGKVDVLTTELRQMKQKMLNDFSKELGGRAEALKGAKSLIAEIPNESFLDPGSVRDLAKNLMSAGVAVVVLGQRLNGKAMLYCGIAPEQAKKIGAGDVIKQIAPQIQGQGGGKPDWAQAGGTKLDRVTAALQSSRELLQQKL